MQWTQVVDDLQSIHPTANSPHLNIGRVGIQCYQPNFWRLSISTRDSTE